MAAQVARQLADPRPADESVTRQLDAYRNLEAHWADWQAVKMVCRQVATLMLDDGR